MLADFFMLRQRSSARGRAPNRCERVIMLACKSALVFIVFLPVELLKRRPADRRGAAEPETTQASARFRAAGFFGPLLEGTAGQMLPRHQNLITAPQLSSTLPTSHICDFNRQRRNRDGRGMSLA